MKKNTTRGNLKLILESFAEDVADQFGGSTDEHPVATTMLETTIDDIRTLMRQLIDETFDKDDKKAYELWEKIKEE